MTDATAGSDGAESTAPPRTPKQEQEPAQRDVTEVAPGVVRMQLPIKMPGLGHVNAYALLDDRGAAVVDPGVPGPGNWNALVDRLGQADLKVGDVHTVVVTHSHIDHFGTAARLARAADAEFVTHADFAVPWLGVQQHDCTPHAEADGPDADDHDHGEESGKAAEPPTRDRPNWHERTPWGGEPIRPPRTRRMIFWMMRHLARRALLPPVPSKRVADGEVLELAGREWLAVHTPGHTLDHLCLHDPAAGVLLSGDHVLPTITPHISGVGTGDDPLQNFIDSLDLVGGIAGVEQVLPAHGHPFGDLPARVEDIKTHHAGRLERLREAGREMGRPASVRELSHHLFRKSRWGPMAESETYAHLEHLRHRGQAERSRQGETVYFELD